MRMSAGMIQSDHVTLLAECINKCVLSPTEAEKGHAQIKKNVTRAHELQLVRTTCNSCARVTTRAH